MFVISGSYKVPIEEVDRVLPAHKAFLDKNYANGTFVCSGPMNPRTGGVIICRAESREEVEQIMREDPFRTENITDYSIIEFLPTKGCSQLQDFLIR